MGPTITTKSKKSNGANNAKSATNLSGSSSTTKALRIKSGGKSKERSEIDDIFSGRGRPTSAGSVMSLGTIASSSTLLTSNKKKKKKSKDSKVAKESEEDGEEWTGFGHATTTNIIPAGDDDTLSKPDSIPKVETILDPSLHFSLLTTKLKQKRDNEVPASSNNKKKAGKYDDDTEKFRDSRGAGPRRITEEGYTIYKEDELGIGDSGGDTPLCPFDCNCCF